MSVIEKIYVFQQLSFPRKHLAQQWLIKRIQRHVWHERMHARINKIFGSDTMIVYFIVMQADEDYCTSGGGQCTSLSFSKNLLRSIMHFGFDLCSRLPWSIFRLNSIWRCFILQVFGEAPKNEKEMKIWLNEEFDKEIPNYFNGKPYRTRIFDIKSR